MAIYNPDNSENGYYSPYQNSQQETGPSLGKVLLGTAKTMAVFGILNVVGRAASKGLSTKATSIITRYSKTAATIQKATGAKTLGGLFAGTSAGKEVRKIFSGSAKSFTSALASKDAYVARIARTQGSTAAKVAGFKSSFKDFRTFAGTVGRSWKQNVWAGAGVAYAIDSFAGVTRDYGITPKAWYDVPGHVGNFGKWLAMDSVYSMGFRGATKFAQMAGIRGMRSVSEVFKGPLGQASAKFLQRVLGDGISGLRPGSKQGGLLFNKKVLEGASQENSRTNYGQHFISSGIRKMLAFGQTVPGSVRVLNETFQEMGENFKHAVSRHNATVGGVFKRTVSDPVAGALRQIKDQWRRSQIRKTEFSPVEHAGLNILQFVDDYAHRLNGIANTTSQTREATAGFVSLTRSFHKLGKSMEGRRTVADHIFPEMDRARNRDVVDQDWVARTQGVFTKHFGEKRSKYFMDMILNMRSGLHMYKPKGGKIQGGGVNLGIFDPVYFARKSVARVLNKDIKIPFTGADLNLGDILQTNLIKESPSFDFWQGRQDFDIGGRAKGVNFVLDRGQVKTLADLDKNTWFTVAMKGQLALVGQDGVKIVQTSDRLALSAPSSSFKKAERSRVELAAGVPGENDTQHFANTGNKLLDLFINRTQLSWPGMVNRLGRKVKTALDGKNYSLIKEAPGAFSDMPLEWYRRGDIIQAIKEGTGQDISTLMRNKGFHQMLANVTGASRFGDSFDVLYNSRALRDRLAAREMELGDEFGHWLNKRGIADDVALIKADPTYARHHATTKRLGHRMEMTPYDKVRVALVEDAFMDAFNQGGDGVEHPIITAIPKLLETGAINPKQAKSLTLFAKLSAFTETSMFDRRNGANPRPEIVAAGREILRKSHRLNWNIQRDVIDYLQTGEFRAASMRDVKLNLTTDNQFRFRNNTAYASVGADALGFAKDWGTVVFDNVNNMLHDTVFPFRKDPTRTLSLRGNAAYLFGGVAKVAAGVFALKALDAVVAANPVFDDTALDAGIGGFLADNVARARLGQSRVFDALGFTGIAKHLNGLMPGFMTTAPGAVIGSVVSRSLGGGLLKGFAFGAVGNRLLSPYLPDFTKSYDQLEDEYSGRVEVPIMKSPTWLLGATPYEGSKVQGYQPNWYVRTKSRWKETDTLYGSTMRKLLHEPLPFLGISIGDFVDPYYMERKHYFSRPYPETGAWGSEVPLGVGPLIAGTIGRIFKPKKTMHQEFLTGPADLTETSAYPFAIQPPTVQESMGMMAHDRGFRTMGGRSSLMGSYVYGTDSKMWAHAAGEDFLNDISNFAGMPGFLGRTVAGKLVNRPLVMPTLETAGRIASMSRSYYDMNLGGMGVFTEPVRRIIDKPDYRKYGINPIPNLMPNWLPQEFLTGDPYAKIIRGELRLPGKAYQVTHRLKKTMPARSSMFGAPEEHMVQYFTGLLPPMLKEEYDILATGTTIHERIQDSLAAEGLLIQAEAVVYDVKNDISGHVDAIVRDGQGGKGRRALEIKSIGQQSFEKLDGPKDQHIGQLNFYLKMLHLQKGTIMYVSRDNPANVKLFNVNYSKSRFDKDLRKLQKARQVTADLMKEGVDDKFGYSYSWLDRLNILADVAPSSKEYKEAKYFVEQQMKFGQLTDDEVTQYDKALRHRQARIRKYELYPNRFKGKILSPDTQRQIQSINEDIKAGSEYTLPERIVGAAWETFTNSNTFLTNKLFAFKDPLEHYKMLQLYGKEYKPWDEVYGSFVEPTMRGMAAQTNPIGGAYKFGMPAYMFLGNIGAVAGGLIGAGYGTVHGLFRSTTDTAYIPEQIKERRDIEGYFDAAKFERNRRARDLSTGLVAGEYQNAMSATLTAFNQSGQDVANLFRATPYMEKPYIEAWLNIKNKKERQEVLKYIPPELKKALQHQWNTMDSKDETQEYDRESSKFEAGGGLKYKFDRSILDPSVNLEDIKLKTVEEAGFAAHDFGLGWNQQMYRMQSSYNDIRAAEIAPAAEYSPPDINAGQVRQAIMEALYRRNYKGSASVYINEGARDINFVNITIRRDRSLTVINALRNETEYYG